jgi:hypothetical protein
MDVRELAKDRLRQYAPKVAAKENLSDEIQELKYRRRSLGGGKKDAPGGQKDPGGRENMLLGCIQKQSILEEELYLTGRWLGRMDRALNALTESERELLGRLYIYPEKGAAELLAEELGVDLKTIYYRSSVALRKFTTAMWGGVEL